MSALTIITGTSRGLGLALARACQRRGDRLLTISRRPTPLDAGERSAAAPWVDWVMDLEEPLPAAERLQAWLTALEPAGRPHAVTMIHNAAVLSPLAPLAGIAPRALVAAARVNLEAPLVLSAAFLGATSAWDAERGLVFINSGLGRRGLAGSASYCATKAGLDNLARAVALEEADRPHGARVVSLAPGVVDTGMQEQLRAADPARFPARQGFVDLQRSGRLANPDAAAAQVLAFLARADFGRNPVADVRDPA